MAAAFPPLSTARPSSVRTPGWRLTEDRIPGTHLVPLLTALTRFLSVGRTTGVLASSPGFLGGEITGLWLQPNVIPARKGGPSDRDSFTSRKPPSPAPSESTSRPIWLWLLMKFKCSGPET